MNAFILLIAAFYKLNGCKSKICFAVVAVNMSNKLTTDTYSITS